VTNTCCLDCAANPCPMGLNCRDDHVIKGCIYSKDPRWGGECLGDCEHFKPGPRPGRAEP